MMKALFSRFNRGLSLKERDRDKDIIPQTREKLPQLPPLPVWPPQRSSATSTLFSSTFKPLPDVSSQSGQDAVSRPTSPRSPTPTQSKPPFIPGPSAERSSTPDTIVASPRERGTPVPTNPTKAANGNTVFLNDSHKKVVFLSPPPTPSTLERPLHDAPGSGTEPVQVPAKTTLSRFQAPQGKDPRGSTSTAASSKTDLPLPKPSLKATSTRSVISPTPSKASDAFSLQQSFRSGTPYSQMSNFSNRVPAASSWSEGAEEDLVSNLGPRERTRQEVLWEIVASEERYVIELLKMKETFIMPLLHPFSSAPSPPAHQPEYDDYTRMGSPVDSVDQLPIAARFMSPLGFRPETPNSPTPCSSRRDGNYTPNIDGESLETDEDDEGDDRLGKGYSEGHSNNVREAGKHNHPRSPYRATAAKSNGKSVPFPSRSHHSLPPPPRGNPNASTHSLGRQPERDRKESQDHHSFADRQATPTPSSRMLRRFKKSTTAPEPLVNMGAVPPHLLPEDLRACLEAIENSILDGHVRLSEGLRKRYDDQYPLVRSLADVFVSNSHLFHGYAAFVLHLERALEQVDNALMAATDKKPKKQDTADWAKVCKYLRRLEEIAVEKGETGLAISLSKPFQRLLKYPLLFQNLLFHTDPSTFEYESTLQMVAEVETIVRSIEDEKIQKEERDKTRDVFARIEGLDRDRQLALPKPSRVLLDERPFLPSQNGKPPSTPPSAMAVKGKTSFKRLSDVLSSGTGIGGKKDLWLVVFNDVVLQCQRTGQTSLPLIAAANGRTTSLPEMQGKAKYATTGRRNVQTKPRNLYKFIKIHTWDIGVVIQPREGVVAMEDVVRSRAHVHSGVQPKIIPLPDDHESDGGGSDHSDTKSKMSFSYWGADKITIQNPSIRARQMGVNGRGRRASPGLSSYSRESSANAKFGTRLLSADTGPYGARPVVRRPQGASMSRRTPHPDDTHTVKATVTRPAWDSNTRTPQVNGTKQRPRLTSQTSNNSPRVATNLATTTINKQLASPAPSEDSGVCLYRQIIAQDSSINEPRSKP